MFATLGQFADRVWEILVTVLAVVMVGWVFVLWFRRSLQPWTLIFKSLITLVLGVLCLWAAHQLGVFGPFLIVLLGVVLSVVWTPHLADWVTRPLTSLFLGADEAPDPRPLYSAAYAQRKRGQPARAVMLVEEQLRRFPNDPEGITLLAQIQAEDLADLPAAQSIILNFCESSQAGPRQVYAALTQLADWQIRLATDAAAAKASLETIVRRYPDTEFALNAKQRLARLENEFTARLNQNDPQKIAVPQGVHNLGLRGAGAYPQPKEVPPGLQAAEYVKHLAVHPEDAATREKLADLYARHFQRLDLATLELEQLVAQPHQTPRRIAEWLNLLATYQIELGADVETVCGTLRRIVQKYPDAPAAEVAQRRLERVAQELRARGTTSTVKLGEYDQRLGLKTGRPGKHGTEPV
jgi:TolA-binding protein